MLPVAINHGSFIKVKMAGATTLRGSCVSVAKNAEFTALKWCMTGVQVTHCRSQSGQTPAQSNTGTHLFCSSGATAYVCAPRGKVGETCNAFYEDACVAGLTCLVPDNTNVLRQGKCGKPLTYGGGAKDKKCHTRPVAGQACLEPAAGSLPTCDYGTTCMAGVCESLCPK